MNKVLQAIAKALQPKIKPLIIKPFSPNILDIHNQHHNTIAYIYHYSPNQQTITLYIQNKNPNHHLADPYYTYHLADPNLITHLTNHLNKLQ
jgi:hypothetical protein